MLLMLSVLARRGAVAPTSAAHAPQPRAARRARCRDRVGPGPARRHRFRATRIWTSSSRRASRGALDARARGCSCASTRPSGFLYQVLETPLERAVCGGGRRFEARLPVAGTSIMTSGLYGRWKVVPHLDDGREACGRARSFVIRP